MERMTESTKSVVDYFGKHITYVNVMRNMSVSCDCEGVNAEPVVTPNVGILSSTDILALDQACVDACLKCDPLPNSQLSDRMHREDFCDHHDHFENTTPDSEYKTCLDHAAKIGLGNREYELIFVK